ncbi:hypothetical protein ACQBAR_04365 [Propionibacteriaceae bacterium Y1685]|uniref:hypothetical protein n=1 Tax=Microlunatus sp. Y1700 TaxID=3418487 RepID=UPI003B768B82
MNPSESHYRLSPRGAMPYILLGLVLTLLGVAGAALLVSIWTTDIMTTLLPRRELIDGRWTDTAPATSLFVVATVACAVIGGLMLTTGVSVLVQAWRTLSGRYGLTVTDEGLHITFIKTASIDWSRVLETTVSGDELALRCRGTTLSSQLGAAEVTKRDRQLPHLLHPRVTTGSAEETVRLAPLGALGERAAAFVADVDYHINN